MVNGNYLNVRLALLKRKYRPTLIEQSAVGFFLTLNDRSIRVYRSLALRFIINFFVSKDFIAWLKNPVYYAACSMLSGTYAIYAQNYASIISAPLYPNVNFLLAAFLSHSGKLYEWSGVQLILWLKT